MDNQVVLLCDVMYTVLIILPVNCNTCPTNCQTCSNNDGGVDICTSCNDGYWLSESSCQPCYDNCATCSNAFSCETCKPGFYSPSSSCHSPCTANCLNGICDENTGLCFACPNNSYGYYCDFDCGLCRGEQCGLRKCTDGCKSGYWQYQNADHLECRICMDNCSLCDTWSICDECNDGAYLSDFSGQRNYCFLCRPGCETCSSYYTCSTCKPGYYGVACEYPCSDIIPDCFQCDWDGGTIITCNQCAHGLTLQDNSCVVTLQKCPNNCESCTDDNVCEICKTEWYGVLCDKSCHDVLHCVACQEMDRSMTCNVCDVGYVVLDGECSVSSTSTTTVLPASTKSNTPTAPRSTETNPTKPANSAVRNYIIPKPSQENTSFQTRSFAVGLGTGLGICLCTLLIIGLVWFLRRRRRLQKPATSRQNEPFYENSVTTNEPNLTPVSYHDPQPENIQQMRVVTENVSESMEDNQQASVYEESELTSSDIEQHEYTGLNVRQGEHIYKDLTAL